MRKLVHSLIVTEFCLIIVFLFIIFTPHNNLSDIKKLYFVDNNINLTSTIRNMYIMDEYDRIFDIVKDKYDSLKENYISFNYEKENIKFNLGNYLSVNDVLINDTTYKDFIVKLNYLKHNIEDYNIELNTDIDEESYVDSVINHFIVYNENMISPKYQFTGSGLQAIDNGKSGKKLNEVLLRDDIINVLKNYESNNTELGSISLVYDEIPVSPSIDDINSINCKLSTFSTGYSSSSSSRKTNISVATNNLNGKLLLPGEVLSVDKAIKSRNASNGYAKAGSYLNGKTVQTYGGGVCQVSTTLYGAILRAGIIPIERNAHSMAVHYVPLGLDAAISEGYKDLKIKNTYDYPIYIQGIANGSTLTFNIYGKEDLLNGYTYAPGSSSSKNGLSADSWLNKYKDGKLVEKISLFKSSYRPHS